MGSFMNTKPSFLTHGSAQHGMVSLLFFLLFLLSCPAIPRAAAQPPNPPGTDSQLQYANFNPNMAVIIVVLVAALFFMGFFSIYIRHCNQTSSGGSVRQALSMRRRAAAAARGLDASVIETFPTFSYAEVKDHHIAKGALECAVCLNEFEDDDTLRLIPKCDHVFHPECIDAWLESHVTCPVCRANLTPQPDDPPVQLPPSELSREVEQEHTENQQQNDDVSIRISNEEEDKRVPQEEEGSIRPVVKRNLSFNVPHRPPRQEESSIKPTVKRNSSLNLPNWPPRSFSMKKPRLFNKFRSHSTGHSLVIPGENLDRYTLRLPEQIRKDVMNRSLLNRTNSSAVTLNRSRTGAGEGSNRGGRLYRRMDSIEPEAKSDRWVFTIAPPFFTRGSSMKSPKMDVNGNGGGEVGSTSTSTSTTRGGGVRSTVKMPSFKCLEPKGDEACLVSHDSARPPV